MQGKGDGVTAAAYAGGQQGEGGQSTQERAFGMSPDSGPHPVCSAPEWVRRWPREASFLLETSIFPVPPALPTPLWMLLRLLSMAAAVTCGQGQTRLCHGSLRQPVGPGPWPIPGPTEGSWSQGDQTARVSHSRRPEHQALHSPPSMRPCCLRTSRLRPRYQHLSKICLTCSLDLNSNGRKQHRNGRLHLT